MGEHFADEIDGILCIEFLHDVSAVKLDRARADAERACGLLAGGSPYDLRQCDALSRGVSNS